MSCSAKRDPNGTWEYLQGITRKEGSYGENTFRRISSDTEQILLSQLSMLKSELLEEMESIYGNAKHATSQTGDNRDEIEKETIRISESDVSDATMTMALVMDDWIPE